MNKTTVAVIFGSRSSEHDVSLVSASNVIANINTDIYDIVLIGITKEGRWLLADSIESVENGTWVNSTVHAIVSPDANDHGLILMKDGQITKKRIDVAFPILHGMYGESSCEHI